MILYSTMRYRLGASEGSYVRGTATTVKEFMAVVRSLTREHGPRAVSVNVVPLGKQALRSKAKPYFSLREEFLPSLVRLEASKVPEEYLWVQIYRLKREFWLAGLDSGDPTDEGEVYFTRHLRARVGALLQGLEGLADPEFEALPQDRLGIILINQWIENFDLGRRDDLKQRYIQGLDVPEKFVSRQERIERMDPVPDEPENITRWKLADREGRLLIQEQSPWIKMQLREFNLDPETT